MSGSGLQFQISITIPMRNLMQSANAALNQTIPNFTVQLNDWLIGFETSTVFPYKYSRGELPWMWCDAL